MAASPPSPDLSKVANSPTGVRFANLPLAMRGAVDISQSEMPSYSSPVTVAKTMESSDKDVLSGVIRKRGMKTNHTLPLAVRG